MYKLSRRAFLTQAAVAGVTALSRPSQAGLLPSAPNKYRDLVPELYEPIPRPPTHTRAVVIGSGFGGAISALRLAEARVDTTVLERGQRWPIDPWREIHAYEPLPDGRGFWQRSAVSLPIVTPLGVPIPIDRFGGVLEISRYPNMEVWRAACVGGGSVVFTGVMIQPPRKYFDMIFGGMVSFDEMDAIYYPRVRAMLALSTMPRDIYHSEPFGHSQLWDQQVASAGYNPDPVESIFDWNVVRDELNGLTRPSATIGMSNLGNSNGAKFDLNRNYLRKAEDTGYASVYPNQQVNDIERTGDGYRVYIAKLSPTGSVIDSYAITCDYLFLAAGSIGTSELLVKAKTKGTIPGLNAEVGRGWGTNGDTVVVRSVNEVRGKTQGAPCASKIHEPDASAPVSFENWYVPGLPVNVGILGTLGMTLDLQNRGSFYYSTWTRRVSLRWSSSGSSLAQQSARELNNRIARYGEPASLPGLPPIVPDVWGDITAHPLGGAVLGKATDTHGRVMGQHRLYVMDGAMIPGSTGTVNPSLTISALAERNIEHIIDTDL